MAWSSPIMPHNMHFITIGKKEMYKIFLNINGI
jgi:hypothetical protein